MVFGCIPVESLSNYGISTGLMFSNPAVAWLMRNVNEELGAIKFCYFYSTSFWGRTLD